MALIEEARSKIRVIRSKLIHREYIRELDNNNRLLAIGQLLLLPVSCYVLETTGASWLSEFEPITSRREPTFKFTTVSLAI